jgi:hypothetical protein
MQKICAEEELNRTGATFETPSRKSLAQLPQHICMSGSTALNAAKLLHLHKNKTTMVYNLYDTDEEARLNFVNLYLHKLDAGEIDPTFIMSSNETWLYLTGHMNSQNNR